MRRLVGSALKNASSSSFKTNVMPRRFYSSGGSPPRKVVVLGAAGGIGQPLALLMKLNPLVSKLALYDIAGTPGVAADVGHINSRAEVGSSFPTAFFSFSVCWICSLCER